MQLRTALEDHDAPCRWRNIHMLLLLLLLLLQAHWWRWCQCSPRRPPAVALRGNGLSSCVRGVQPQGAAVLASVPSRIGVEEDGELARELGFMLPPVQVGRVCEGLRTRGGRQAKHTE